MQHLLYKTVFALGLATTLTTTSCIDETFPTDVATEDQLASSNKSTEALLWAMPAFFNQYSVAGGRSYDWGYGSLMHVRDVMTEDMAVVSHGYDWYSSWAENKYMGELYAAPQFIWNYYWKAVQTANNMISAVNPETATETQLGYLGAASAFRALYYLEMSQSFEFLENDQVSSVNDAGNDVRGLTVPIVREGMDEKQTRNNPRVSRETMAKFILSDLDNAEKNIGYLKFSDKTLPHLDAVYGLKARCHMWLGNYAEAKEFARKAIDASSCSPMTETECLSTVTGFNDISKWMWGSKMQKEDDVVKTGILNWASWMSNECTFGFANAGPKVMISKRLYDRISDSDFRKKMWKSPAGSVLEGQTDFIRPGMADEMPAYASVKFRPNEGNIDDPTVGAASAFPVMRIEEMYFIEAEAAAHLNEAEGQKLLLSFMKKYRDPSYEISLSGPALIDEIVLQKRIELWGEGLSFFDFKRLNMSVIRGYEGTNFGETKRFNTKGRPAWMNLCIVQTEKNNNAALVGYENPDPSDVYKPWLK